MHAYATPQPRMTGFVVIGFVAVVLAMGANAIAEGVGAPPAWLIGAPALAGAYGLCFQVFDRWAWRWPPLKALRVPKTPDIEGVYEGELRSSFEGAPVLTVRIEIDQSWTAIAIRFEVTGETTSTSNSVTAGLEQSGHEHARLSYTYRNQTSPGIAPEDLNDHDGTAELTFYPTGRVRGRYYNLRGRNGSLELERVGDLA